MISSIPPFHLRDAAINGPPERPIVQSNVVSHSAPPRPFGQASGESFEALFAGISLANLIGDVTGGGSVWELDEDDWEDERGKLERVGDLSPNGAFGRCLVLRIDVSPLLAQVGTDAHEAHAPCPAAPNFLGSSTTNPPCPASVPHPFPSSPVQVRLVPSNVVGSSGLLSSRPRMKTSGLGCSSSSTRSASAGAPGREKTLTTFASLYVSVSTRLDNHWTAGVICQSTTPCRIPSSFSLR